MSAPAPRYVLTDVLPHGLRRVVRADGTALCAVAPPAPPPWWVPPRPPPPAGAWLVEALAQRAQRVATTGKPGRLVRPRLPVPEDRVAAGQQVRARREALGWSQRGLAAAAGLSRGLVAMVEVGKRAAGGASWDALGRALAGEEAGRDGRKRPSTGGPGG